MKDITLVLLEIYFNSLINKLEAGEVAAVIKDLKEGLAKIKEDNDSPG